VQGKNKFSEFNGALLPHLDAAYNFARWLTKNPQDAEDVVQEAILRAFDFYDGFHGENFRSWLLTIVRNTCFTWLKKNRSHEFGRDANDDVENLVSSLPDPQTKFLQMADQEKMRKAIEHLAVEFREVIILKEFEGLSYKEIGRIIKVPIGTVMSRLSRARVHLQEYLVMTGEKGDVH